MQCDMTLQDMADVLVRSKTTFFCGPPPGQAIVPLERVLAFLDDNVLPMTVPELLATANANEQYHRDVWLDTYMQKSDAFIVTLFNQGADPHLIMRIPGERPCTLAQRVYELYDGGLGVFMENVLARNPCQTCEHLPGGMRCDRCLLVNLCGMVPLGKRVVLEHLTRAVRLNRRDLTPVEECVVHSGILYKAFQDGRLFENLTDDELRAATTLLSAIVLSGECMLFGLLLSNGLCCATLLRTGLVQIEPARPLGPPTPGQCVCCHRYDGQSECGCGGWNNPSELAACDVSVLADHIEIAIREALLSDSELTSLFEDEPVLFGDHGNRGLFSDPALTFRVLGVIVAHGYDASLEALACETIEEGLDLTYLISMPEENENVAGRRAGIARDDEPAMKRRRRM